ncbi:hypothetical protein F4821DRAFT_234814 [Hypoxylon rubiginosum]|uniref:Uncharacterized protein n=1 Tax=Hypoxylon rubiginosum TaxID=110542 RepID=A0ACC0D649_9PEZI|nr:hypothetical protein F4821DRAFT_234814 [Hypoxylon rubiginosum]
MSSITTSIPISPISSWCLTVAWFYDGTRHECANETLGFKKSDFQTFCCNGDILDTKKDVWKPSTWHGDSAVNLADMVCCGLDGAQAGGIHPLPTAYTTCSAGSPTPLASLAGTNTDNAAAYLVTYTSASYGDNGAVGNFIPTETPTCFWAYKASAEMEEITLPAPDIKTLPPATTDELGLPITPTSESIPTSTSTSTSSSTAKSSGTTSLITGIESLSQTASQGSSETASAATTTSTPSSAVSTRTSGRKGYIGLCLGLAAVRLFWS